MHVSKGFGGADLPSNESVSTNQLAGHSLHGEAFNEGPRQKAYLMGGTGKVHFPITTKTTEAQAFFDQGIGQLHGFWYFEAERSFRQAAALDSDCALAYWGMAMANINNATRAKEFIQKALEKKAGASRREVMWIEAYADFYKEETKSAPSDENKKYDANAEKKSAKPNEDTPKEVKGGKAADKKPEKSDAEKDKERRRELVKKLEAIIFEFPEDVEAKAFLAFHIWDNSGRGWPIPSQQSVTALIKEVLAVEPMHPAHHYMIHLWDGDNAVRAVQSAARCGQAAPSVAHMWHMPGHIFSKLHRYADAAWQQEASARVDHAYMLRDRILPDQIHNYAHNNQWLVESFEFVGRVRDAIDLAKNLIELPRHPKYNTLTKTNLQNSYETRYGSATYGRSRLVETLIRFELWNEIIDLSETVYLEPTDYPPEQARRARALGIAHFSRGETEKGRAQIQTMEAALRLARDQRQADAERAEEKARKDKKSEDKITEAMTEALKANTDKIRGIESGLAELQAYDELAKTNNADAWILLESVKDMPKERLARLRLAAGDLEKAEELAREAVEGGTNRVHLFANYVDVLYRCGKQDKAKEEFEKLRRLSAHLDLDAPPFLRLKPLIQDLNLPADWRVASTVSADAGERPRLDELGPFRWQPPPAPKWSLSDADGRPLGSKDFEGKPVVLIFFLGHGCAHCIQQLSVFEPMVAQFTAAGISLVGVSMDTVEGLKKTTEKSKLPADFPLVSDHDLAVFKRYGAFDDFEGLPLHGTFLIDERGLVRWQDISFEPFQEPKFLLAESKRLLQQSRNTRLAGK
jgi:peroxiredoxin